jgi:hypothetical protein
MILGFFWMLVANTACLLGAHAILRRIATGEGHVDLVCFFLLRFLLISTAILVSGLTRTLSAIPLGIAGVFVLAVLLILKEHRHLPRLRLPPAGPLFLTLGLIVAIRLIGQVWFFSPYNYDALSYHLTKIPEWIRAAGFTREMGVDTHATFPAGFELVETWWVVFLHHDVLIEMAGVEFLALGSVATYALAKWAGISGRFSFLAGLIYSLTPGVHLSATSCLNDVPVAALVLATAALIVGRAPLAWVPIAAGMGIGIKPTFLYAVPGLFLLVLLLKRVPRLEAKSRLALFSLASVAFLAGSFWYVRNALWFGNPIHPVGTKGLIVLGGHVQIQFGPSFSSGWKNLVDLANDRIYDDRVGYSALLSHTSGWGSLAFGCGLVALLVAVRSNRNLRLLFLGLSVSLLSVLFLVNHDPWCLRFVLFYPALFAVAVASLAEQSQSVLVLAGAALAFEFLGTMLPIELPVTHLKVLAAQRWHERSMAPIFGVRVPTESVAYFVREPVHNRGESYLLYGPDYSIRPLYLRAETAVEVRAEMDSGGVQTLYSARNNLPDEPVLVECLRQGLLRKIAGRLYTRQ